jgi:hypothetical protein
MFRSFLTLLAISLVSPLSTAYAREHVLLARQVSIPSLTEALAERGMQGSLLRVDAGVDLRTDTHFPITLEATAAGLTAWIHDRALLDPRGNEPLHAVTTIPIIFHTSVAPPVTTCIPVGATPAAGAWSISTGTEPLADAPTDIDIFTAGLFFDDGAPMRAFLRWTENGPEVLLDTQSTPWASFCSAD